MGQPVIVRPAWLAPGPRSPRWPAAVRRPGARMVAPAVAAVTGALAAVVGVLTSMRSHLDPWWVWLPMQAVGPAFTTAGVLALLRRPDNRTGRLLAAVGVAWYLVDLRDGTQPVLFAVGFSLFYLGPVILTHLVMALPTGRLERTAERVVAAGFYVSVVSTQTMRYLVEHPRPPQSWTTPSATHSGWASAGSISGLVLTLAAIGLVVRRWRRAGRPTRRTHALVWVTGTAIGLTVLVTILASLLRAGEVLHQRLALLYTASLILLPFAILAGVLRVRIARMRVADLVLRLEATAEPRHLCAALATTLGDPTLQVCFRRQDEDGYIDADGRPVRLPEHSGRAVTPVERRGERLAVLVHDPVLAEQRPLVDAVLAAARLALDNARLLAGQRAQLAELHASRARIVTAVDAERRRIQRDLHDGVQHTLLAVAMLVRRAREELPSRPSPLLESAGLRLHEVIREMRELTAGIDPPALTEQGLAAAVEGLAERAPLPVRFTVPPRRWPEPVERTAYFVITEALANVHKHARATAAVVEVDGTDGVLVVRVVDDGAGGADPDRGTGLRGLRDRVAAASGRLSVCSPPGAGTRIEAELPCG